jgi:alpha-L-fucosidase 2
MLLQSWSAAPGSGDWGVIRIFPATPWRWHEASFDDLRAEGGHRVSAKREHNATTWFRIVAGRDGMLRIRDNFAGRNPSWSRKGVTKIGDNFEVALKRGETIEATLPKPADTPAPPSDAAEPVIIRKR